MLCILKYFESEVRQKQRQPELCSSQHSLVMESFRSWPCCLLFMQKTGKWILLRVHRFGFIQNVETRPRRTSQMIPRAHALHCMPSPAEEWQRGGRLNSEFQSTHGVFVPWENTLKGSLKTTHSVWRTCFRENKHPVFASGVVYISK